MIYWMRSGWRRWLLVRLACWLGRGRMHDALVEFLYPDNMRVTFADDCS